MLGKLNKRFLSYFHKNLGSHQRYAVNAKVGWACLPTDNKLVAFTLAEVLITLGIIGIVAAMTIPSLMQKTQDKELKVAWKKNYSVLNQVVMRMAVDNGGSIVGVFTSGSDMRDKFAQYLLKSKVCDDSIGQKCWAPDTKGLDNSTGVLDSGSSIMLNDGSLVQFWLNDSNCVSDWGTPPVYKRCGGGVVDVNGLKKPNVIGKDIFPFSVLDGRILPYGLKGDPYENTCNTSSEGDGCSALYLYND